MNKYGKVYHKIHDKAINGKDLKTCLFELKNACLSLEINDLVFILDNDRIHHYSGLSSMIESLNLNLQYLPAYSPFLNPIENCLLIWKNYVIRMEALNETQLKNFIDFSFNEVTLDNCDCFYRKMLRYINRSANSEVILE
ncbi:hypothetical protein A0H76_1339 [Hepatospora eriocheir]|uniref:Tc1-like transposase DDE domain-containing protein n=1 Tax=Hepatospora eriocheir TaxID=1081669 RepID=A0A1X0QHA4_9MICR|nr:hypothetical protein A0H76_1339 [Hepatospora eriocheir]